MEFKQFITPFILFLIGGCFYILGAVIKISHWEMGFINGSLFLILGSLFDFIAILIVIIKLIKIYKNDKS